MDVWVDPGSLLARVHLEQLVDPGRRKPEFFFLYLMCDERDEGRVPSDTRSRVSVEHEVGPSRRSDTDRS